MPLQPYPNIRIRETGQVVSENEFRAMHPNTSGPITALMEQFGADPILQAPMPETTRFQSAVRNGVVQDSLGNWVQAWTVVDWTQEQIDAAIEQQWVQVKAERDSRLANTDWYVIRELETGTPKPEGMQAYRQALRDITLQADPFNITWPVNP
jgi:hypothetical protein